jgi:hypothetical protein
MTTENKKYRPSSDSGVTYVTETRRGSGTKVREVHPSLFQDRIAGTRFSYVLGAKKSSFNRANSD